MYSAKYDSEHVKVHKVVSPHLSMEHAEHLGYQYAKENGQVKLLGAGETLAFDIEAGYLDKERADKLIKAKKLM